MVRVSLSHWLTAPCQHMEGLSTSAYKAGHDLLPAVSCLNASPPSLPIAHSGPVPMDLLTIPSNTPNPSPPSTDSSMFVFPPHSHVEAATPHAMVLGHGVFGRLLGLDEVMRVVPLGGNLCP